MSYCENGHQGRCCCNCRNQIEMFKHPWNKKYKGEISESAGLYACIVSHDMNCNRKGIISETPHGSCELYVDHFAEPNK